MARVTTKDDIFATMIRFHFGYYYRSHSCFSRVSAISREIKRASSYPLFARARYIASAMVYCTSYVRHIQVSLCSAFELGSSSGAVFDCRPRFGTYDVTYETS